MSAIVSWMSILPSGTLPQGRVTAESAAAMTAGKVTKVTYVAPNIFVDVLTDILMADSGKKLYTALYKAIEPLPSGPEKSEIRELIRRFQNTGQGFRELMQATDRLSDQQVKQELRQALDWFEAALEKYGLESGELIPLLIGIRQIQNPALQQALEAVLSSAAINSLRDAEAKLAEWFNSSMARVSDLYTRNMQFLSLFVGLMLALILNVDTLHLAGTLWNDPALRQTVAAAAENSAERLRRTEVADPSTEQGEQLIESAQRAQSMVRDLLDLRLPIGWEFTPPSTDDNPAVVEVDPGEDLRDLSNFLPGYNSNWLGFLLRKLLGIGVTMVAIAQGAPFWFNLLNRLARGGRTSDVQEESRG